jgi:hypothetical protein
LLQLAIEDPADVALLDELRFALDVKFKPVLVSPSDLDDALRRHYQGVTEQAGADPLNDGDLATAADESPTAVQPLSREHARAVPTQGSPDISTTIMLRALAQLLVEKGILDRTEFVERIAQLTAESGRERRASRLDTVTGQGDSAATSVRDDPPGVLRTEAPRRTPLRG